MNTVTMRASAPAPRVSLQQYNGLRATQRAAPSPAAELRSAKGQSSAPRAPLEVSANLKAMRDRIGSVKNTKKITDAMKLVAAAKVRRAQAAVLGARPFSENLVKVLFAVNTKLEGEDVDVPLTAVRPVKTALLVCVSGDRGLCGGYNNFVIKKTVSRVKELKALGVDVKLVTIGKKCSAFFKRRPEYSLVKSFEMGSSPTTTEAQAIADEVFSEFVSEGVDKVELVYTRFVSLISSRPTTQTLLPLTPSGEVCNVDGKCVDAAEDEIFSLTTKEGQFAVDRNSTRVETAPFDGVITFEQDPNQILDALLPLYMNSQILRALQESIASELAARMTAMGAASDNAKSLGKQLNLTYNRKRQAKITNEIIELVAGASV